MGQLTRTQIVSAGLQKAGDPSLTTHANTWLNAALRRAYRSWPWPFLHKRYTGLALGAGVTSLSFGNGSTEALEVPRIFDPIKVYTSDYRSRGKGRIRQLVESDTDHDAVYNDPTQGRGIPTTFKLRADNSLLGKWTLYPWPVPDKAYLLGLEYLIQPANLSSDASVPIYPEDDTMIQMVYVDALRFMDDERGQLLAKIQLEEDRLNGLLIRDRLAWGSAEGVNEDQLLDDGVFT